MKFGLKEKKVNLLKDKMYPKNHPDQVKDQGAFF